MRKNNEIKKEIALDDLARLVVERFDDVDRNIAEIKTDVSGLRDDVSQLKNITHNIKANLNKKVDKFDHKDLEYRVEKMEKKFA